MFRISHLIYTIAAPTLAGIAMVGVLVQPDYTPKYLIAAAAAGALAAIPLSWYVAKQITK